MIQDSLLTQSRYRSDFLQQIVNPVMSLTFDLALIALLPLSVSFSTQIKGVISVGLR